LSAQNDAARDRRSSGALGAYLHYVELVTALAPWRVTLRSGSVLEVWADGYLDRR
jgi:hypothetical protein